MVTAACDGVLVFKIQWCGLREALVSKAITEVCIDERVSSAGLLTKIVLNVSLLSGARLLVNYCTGNWTLCLPFCIGIV